MLDHLIKSTRTALTWPFDLAADFLRQSAEGLLDASSALEMLGNITDPNPNSSPWEPGEADYQKAAEIIRDTTDLRTIPWQDYSEADADIDGYWTDGSTPDDRGTTVYTPDTRRYDTTGNRVIGQADSDA